jgi:hypothetical protein
MPLNNHTLNMIWFQVMKATMLAEADHIPTTFIVMRHGQWVITEESML